MNGLLISLLVNYLYGSASWYEENLYSKSDLSFGFLMGHLSQIPNGRIRFHSLFRHISCLNGPSQLLSTKGKSSLGRKSEYGMMGDLPPLISAKYECMARKPQLWQYPRFFNSVTNEKSGLYHKCTLYFWPSDTSTCIWIYLVFNDSEDFSLTRQHTCSWVLRPELAKTITKYCFEIKLWTRHVFMKHGCPRWQQSQNMAKICNFYILTPHPQRHVMSVKCEEPIYELTVQVWLLYYHPNLKYFTL